MNATVLSTTAQQIEDDPNQHSWLGLISISQMRGIFFHTRETTSTAFPHVIRAQRKGINVAVKLSSTEEISNFYRSLPPEGTSEYHLQVNNFIHNYFSRKFADL